MEDVQAVSRLRRPVRGRDLVMNCDSEEGNPQATSDLGAIETYSSRFPIVMLPDSPTNVACSM